MLNLSLLGAGVSELRRRRRRDRTSVGGQRPRNNSFNIEGVDNNRKDVTGPVASVPERCGRRVHGPPESVQRGVRALLGRPVQHRSAQRNQPDSRQGLGISGEQGSERDRPVVQAAVCRARRCLPSPATTRTVWAAARRPDQKEQAVLLRLVRLQSARSGQRSGSPTYAPTAAGYSLLAGIPPVNPAIAGGSEAVRWRRLRCRHQAHRSERRTVAGVDWFRSAFCRSSRRISRTVFRWLVSVDYNLSDKDQLRARYIDNKIGAIDTAANLPIFFTPRPTTAHIATRSRNFTISRRR